MLQNKLQNPLQYNRKKHIKLTKTQSNQKQKLTELLISQLNNNNTTDHLQIIVDSSSSLTKQKPEKPEQLQRKNSHSNNNLDSNETNHSRKPSQVY